MHLRTFFPFILLLLLMRISPTPTFALIPDEVVVIANTRANDSLSLAKYYMQQRNIPKENLVRIRTTGEESCSREEYQDTIAKPVKKAVQKLRGQKRIRCLVTMYGVPLKIRPPLLDVDGEEEVNLLQQEIKQKQEHLQTAQKLEQRGLTEAIESLKLQVKLLQRTDTRAAVDSELALVLSGDYPQDSWLPNPYFLGFQRQKTLLKRDQVLIVSRLDGPRPETVRRIIDDTIATEHQGLQGQACFDARWPPPTKEKELSGYALYDAAIHKAAERLATAGSLSVVQNQEGALFQPGECPSPALYCGWYSLGKYTDVFGWARGAVGYHIASSECVTLKQESSQVWCKRMLEEGAAVVIGPVYEPYVQAFPFPDIFFSKLTEGYLTVGETYLISLPFLSWQMVMVGDPLYLPFQPTPSPAAQ